MGDLRWVTVKFTCPFDPIHIMYKQILVTYSSCPYRYNCSYFVVSKLGFMYLHSRCLWVYRVSGGVFGTSEQDSSSFMIIMEIARTGPQVRVQNWGKGNGL